MNSTTTSGNWTYRVAYHATRLPMYVILAPVRLIARAVRRG